MKYKVMQENDSHFVVHDGKDHFKVAKKGLSKDLIAKIQSYPRHYDEGTDSVAPMATSLDDASATVDGGDRAPASDSRVSYLDALKQLGGDLVYGAGKVAEPLIAPLTTGAGAEGQQNYNSALSSLTGQPQVNPDRTLNSKANPDGSVSIPPKTTPLADVQGGGSAAGPAIPGMPQGYDPMGALGKYKSAVMGVAKAQGKTSDDQGKIMDDYVTDMQVRQAADKEQLDSIASENENLFKGVMDSKVDPNRIWSDQGTGNKLGAAIALIVGGIGAGMGHTSNQALEIMQKAIDRDVDAQKIDIGKKQNLLTYNLQKYRDMQMAQSATKLQLSTIANAQLQQAALKNNSPQAIAQAKLLQSQADMQYGLPLYQAVQQRQMLAHSYNGVPAQSGMDQYLLQMDPKWSEHRVEVHGNAFRASTPKAAEELNKTIPVYNDITEKLNRLKELNNMGTRLSPELAQEAQGLTHQLGMQINEFNGYKRFTDVDDKIIAKQYDDPLAFKTIFTNNSATNALLKSMRSKMEGDLTQQLPGYKGMKGIDFKSVSSGTTLPLNNKGR